MKTFTKADETTKKEALGLLLLEQNSQQTTTVLQQFSAMDAPPTSDEDGSDPNPVIENVDGVSDNRNEQFIKCTNVSTA